MNKLARCAWTLLLVFFAASAPSAQTLTCPIVQSAVAGDAKPDAELFKQLLRCKKGEKSVAANEEGAVTVEVTELRVGSPRPWAYSLDIGSGQEGTLVYPVKATYSVRTHYRAATEIEDGWIRVLNFYVDGFGEWRIGSEEPVKSPSSRRVPVS